jgi:hypothetical protein
MNLNYATLFPDLEGAARQANIDAVLRLSEAIVSLGSRAASSLSAPSPTGTATADTVPAAIE